MIFFMACATPSTIHNTPPSPCASDSDCPSPQKCYDGFCMLSDAERTIHVTESKTEPSTEPQTEPSTEPQTESSIEPQTESSIEPQTESSIEPQTEPSIELQTESSIEPQTEPNVEMTLDANIESTPEETIKENIIPDCCVAGTTRSCYTGNSNTIGKGICKEGLQKCGLSCNWGLCIGEITPKTEECNGKDDDCDGKTDEGIKCDCLKGDTQDCYTAKQSTIGVGVCKKGTQSCTANHTWGKCMNEIIPQAEICDGKDNNCNGKIDEGIKCDCLAGHVQVCYTGPKSTIGVGICKKGSQSCIANHTWGQCKNEVTPKSEICNGKDDDCDGNIDNAISSNTCVVAGKQGICASGKSKCVNGRILCIQQMQPQTEICDGKDNDCDGKIDNNLNLPKCPKQQGVCQGSTQLCINAKIYPCDKNIYYLHNHSYEAYTEKSCDGKDNDCDGYIDEYLKHRYYRDRDKDRYGDSRTSKLLCKASNGYVAKRNDCNDNNKEVHPYAGYHSTPYGQNNFDYNCSNWEEKEYTTRGYCYLDRHNKCRFKKGYTNYPSPSCGKKFDCIIKCDSKCKAITEKRTQQCK